MMGRGKTSFFHDLYYQQYNELTRVKLYNSTKDSLDLLQRLQLIRKLPVHHGCVNSLCWNESGEFLLSGSDDQHLVVTHGFNYKVLSDYKTTHRANIFSAKFLPATGDTNIVSCSGDGMILYTDLVRPHETRDCRFSCHAGTAYEVHTLPRDPNCFLSCGEDGTVRCFDLRVKRRCLRPRCSEDVMITCPRAATALALSPLAPCLLAVGCSDSTVRVFDRRMLSTRGSGAENRTQPRPLCSLTVPGLGDRSLRITSLCFSPRGEDLLASFSSDHLYLFGLQEHGMLRLSAIADASAEVDAEADSWAEQGVRGPPPPPPVRRLRLRGDWSDTGPDARPERDAASAAPPDAESGGSRPSLHAALMRRMTDVLARMLNDPATRAALGGGAGGSSGGSSESAVVDGSRSSTEDRVDTEDQQVQEMQESSPVTNETENFPSITETTSSASEPATSVPEGGEGSSSMVESEEVEESDAGGVSEAEGISSLQNKLSSLREGFIESHGCEPAVRLTYSEKSSSSATISIGVADEVSRSFQTVPSSEEPLPPSNNMSTREEQEPAPGPSSVAEAEYFEKHDPSDSEEDIDDRAINDCYTFTRGSALYSSHSRGVHPIEKHMDEAVRAARGEVPHEMATTPSSSHPYIKQKYTGHRNARTMIKEATFWGEAFVLSGSDCGHVFAWERGTGELRMLLEADRHVVNCLRPHPTLPLLASAGIDHDIKLWAPAYDSPAFDSDLADALVRRNEVMLEETKDTITVPASFMIRMLACLNQIRRGGRNRSRSGRPSDESSNN